MFGICKELDDTWAWVALGPKRQPNVATGVSESAREAPTIEEGALAVPTPVQARQPPLVARLARNTAQRLARVAEEVHEIRWALGDQREGMDAIARDLSEFTIWATRGISQLLDSIGATYTFNTPYGMEGIRRIDVWEDRLDKNK
nr:hypothetical protein [Tanacetum cinerariifolium]